MTPQDLAWDRLTSVDCCCSGPERWSRIRRVGLHSNPERWYVMRGFSGSVKPESDCLVDGEEAAVVVAEAWVKEAIAVTGDLNK